MRGFIAIRLHDLVGAGIEEMMDALPEPKGIRRTPTENLHLTLKFMGEIEGKALEETVLALREIAGETPAFPLSFTGFGRFPAKGTPRTLWLAAEASPSLLELGETVAKRIPYGDGKPFSPHITLARVKTPGAAEEDYINALFRQKPALPGQWVGEIALMESVLRPKAPEYNARWEFKLKDGVESKHG